MTTAPATPAEFVAAMIAWLTQAVVGRKLLGRLAGPVADHIINRLREINQRFGRIAARVGSGRYKPRAATARRPARPGKPRAADPLPRARGWLFRLVPETVVATSQMEVLSRDPAMQELMAAAPASLGRPLRALCRMLRVDVPAVIAPPVRPRPPRPPRPAKSKPPPRPPLEGPAWMRLGPPRKPWSLARMGVRRRP